MPNKTIVAFALVLLAAGAQAQKDKGKPVTVKVPPLPPLTNQMLHAELKRAAWVPKDAGWPKGVMEALIGVDPVSDGRTIYLKVPAGGKLPMHTHTHAQNMIAVTGAATLTLDGKPHAMVVGNFAFIPSKALHAVDCVAGADCVFIVQVMGPPDVQWVADKK